MPLPNVNGTLSLQGALRSGDATKSTLKHGMLIRLTPENIQSLQDFTRHRSIQAQFGVSPVRTSSSLLLSAHF